MIDKVSKFFREGRAVAFGSLLAVVAAGMLVTALMAGPLGREVPEVPEVAPIVIDSPSETVSSTEVVDETVDGVTGGDQGQPPAAGSPAPGTPEMGSETGAAGSGLDSTGSSPVPTAPPPPPVTVPPLAGGGNQVEPDEEDRGEGSDESEGEGPDEDD